MRGKLSAYNLPAQHYGLWRALLVSGLHYGLWRALLDVGSVEYSSTLPRRLTAQNPPQPHTAAPWRSVWNGSAGGLRATLGGAPPHTPDEIAVCRGSVWNDSAGGLRATLGGAPPHTPDCQPTNHSLSATGGYSARQGHVLRRVRCGSVLLHSTAPVQKQGVKLPAMCRRRSP